MDQDIDKPKDFIRFICTRCGEVEDFFTEPCVCNATRDHTPIPCPADPNGRSAQWRIDRVICREGSPEWKCL